MKNLAKHIDSTYLKTAQESGLSESEILDKIKDLTEFAIENDLAAVMIRPTYVKQIRKLLDEKNAKVKLGTVIDFPKGNSPIGLKLAEMQKAITAGADELDVVMNYTKFKTENIDSIEEELFNCTQFALKKQKTIKWIIEVAALNSIQIQTVSAKIRDLVLEKFPNQKGNVFVKSSTGYFTSDYDAPSGATSESISLMVEHAKPLLIKASGGIRNEEDARNFIKLGVTRLGTSSAPKILNMESLE